MGSKKNSQHQLSNYKCSTQDYQHSRQQLWSHENADHRQSPHNKDHWYSSLTYEESPHKLSKFNWDQLTTEMAPYARMYDEYKKLRSQLQCLKHIKHIKDAVVWCNLLYLFNEEVSRLNLLDNPTNDQIGCARLLRNYNRNTMYSISHHVESLPAHHIFESWGKSVDPIPDNLFTKFLSAVCAPAQWLSDEIFKSTFKTQEYEYDSKELENPFEVPYDASAIKKELRAARRLAERVKQNEKEISKLKAELNDLKSLKTKINSHSNKLSELGEEMKTLSKRKSANTSPLFLPSEEEVSEWEKEEDTTGKDGKNQCTILPSSPLYDYSPFSSASTAKSNADENMFAIGVSSTEQEQSDDEHEKYVPTTKSKDYTTKKNKEEESRGQSSKKPLTTSKKKRK